MALKFLNKKGWHTGSLRNIENVWKAEQKHDAEQKKLEELRKQIQEERERSEFRLLQEQAGLVPKQERLEFLYDSGLAVGKGNSDGFKALESLPSNDQASSSSAKPQESVPGALFEDKPQSANDAWRKLHSDPLLMIRQREQEALGRIKNNPVQMAMIRKSVEEKKPKEKKGDRKEENKPHHKSSKHHKHSSSRHHSEKVTPDEERKKSGTHKRSNYEEKAPTDSEDEGERGRLKRKKHHKDVKHKERSSCDDKTRQDSEDESGRERPRDKRHHKDLKYKEQTYSDLHNLISGENDNLERIKHREKSKDDKYFPGERRNDVAYRDETGNKSFSQPNHSDSPANRHESHYRRRNTAPKLTEEERAAKLREMQMDVELHEEQRRKRLRKAEENDVREAAKAGISRGRNFLDATQKSVYGAEKGGSSTIEESVRRRTHYLQGRSEVEGNAFRR